jgi:hypothetical protein
MQITGWVGCRALYYTPKSRGKQTTSKRRKVFSCKKIEMIKRGIGKNSGL